MLFFHQIISFIFLIGLSFFFLKNHGNLTEVTVYYVVVVLPDQHAAHRNSDVHTMHSIGHIEHHSSVKHITIPAIGTYCITGCLGTVLCTVQNMFLIKYHNMSGSLRCRVGRVIRRSLEKAPINMCRQMLTLLRSTYSEIPQST